MHYFSIKNEIVAEVEIKKSRFIALITPVDDEESAQRVIRDSRGRWPDARHYCYAYILRYPNRIERYSDDGEPSGTAGLPILGVLKNNELENVVAVVTRYFGGTLLGASGLVRAYSGVVSQALDTTEKTIFKLCQKLKIECEYSFWGNIENKCLSGELLIDDINFGAGVELNVFIPVSRVTEFLSRIESISNGTASITILEKEYVPIK